MEMWRQRDREREGVQRGALSFVYWLSVRLLTAAGQCRARESHSPSSIYSSVDRLFSILIQCTHYDIIGLAVNGLTTLMKVVQEVIEMRGVER